ncbi:hypothetical protein GW17_00026983, partial [Ensete ventricosum]
VLPGTDTEIISVHRYRLIYLVEEEEATEVVAIDEDSETEIGEVGGEGEEELNHHIVNATGGSVGEDEVGSGGDEDA